MTNAFSDRSLAHLRTCHPALYGIMTEALVIVDHAVTCGLRSKADQDAAVHAGMSHVRWPHSKHNVVRVLNGQEVDDEDGQSRAVDAVPYFAGLGYAWDPKAFKPADTYRIFDHFAGIVIGIGQSRGIPIVWGGDWDSNHFPGDESSFHDLPHFQLTDATK